MARMFLKGEPVPLGTIQILIGIVMIALGTVTWFMQTLQGENPPSLGLCIKSAIALNIISALTAMSGICYFCFALAIKSDLSRCTKLLYGIKGILLALSVLELCLCMTTVVFSCKVIMHTPVTKMECVVMHWESSIQNTAKQGSGYTSAYEQALIEMII